MKDKVAVLWLPVKISHAKLWLNWISTLETLLRCITLAANSADGCLALSVVLKGQMHLEFHSCFSLLLVFLGQ